VLASLSGVGGVSPPGRTDCFFSPPSVKNFCSCLLPIIGGQEPLSAHASQASGGRVFLSKRDVTGQAGKLFFTYAY